MYLCARVVASVTEINRADVLREQGQSGDTEEKRKWQKLNFQPPDTPENNPSVFERHRKEPRELHNDLWCRVQLCRGRGTEEVVPLRPDPAVRLNLLCPLHHQLMHLTGYCQRRQHWYTLVQSPSLAPTHFALWRHPAAGRAHWLRKSWPCWSSDWQLQWRKCLGVVVVGGPDALYGSVQCTQNSLLLLLCVNKHTIVALFWKPPSCALN